MNTDPQTSALKTFSDNGRTIIYDMFLSNKSGELELVVVGPSVPSLVNHEDIHIFDGNRRLHLQVVPDLTNTLAWPGRQCPGRRSTRSESRIAIMQKTI